MIIANACDGAEPGDRHAAVAGEISGLGALGYDVRELDLRDHLGDADGLRNLLAATTLVWVRGGNVFALRHALRRAGADVMIAGMLADDAVVYAGYSAGPCVLAPSLRGLEACDDPEVVQRLWGEPAIFEGLGVLDHAIVPHVDSPGHPECALLEQVAATYRRAGIAHRTLRDGDVLLIDGDRAELLLRRT